MTIAEKINAECFRDSIGRFLPEENEKEYRVIVYECGFPSQALFCGKLEECEVIAHAWDIQNRNQPYYGKCHVGIEEVRYDEDGNSISFTEQKEEYFHCWEMGDFDY